MIIALTMRTDRYNDLMEGFCNKLKSHQFILREYEPPAVIPDTTLGDGRITVRDSDSPFPAIIEAAPEVPKTNEELRNIDKIEFSDWKNEMQTLFRGVSCRMHPTKLERDITTLLIRDSFRWFLNQKGRQDDTDELLDKLEISYPPALIETAWTGHTFYIIPAANGTTLVKF